MSKSITALAAAAILAAGIGLAGAQGTGKSEMIKSDTQCWDTSLNMPRERMPATTGTTTGSNTAGTTGSKAATGPTGSSSDSKSPTASDSQAKRPDGMPNC